MLTSEIIMIRFISFYSILILPISIIIRIWPRGSLLVILGCRITWINVSYLSCLQLECMRIYIMAMWNPWRGCHKCSEGCKYCYIHKGDDKRGIDTNSIVKTDKFTISIVFKKYK